MAARAGQERLGKGVVGKRAVGVDAQPEDRLERIAADDVHPLEPGHHRLLRGREPEPARGQPRVAAGPRGRLVERRPQERQSPLAARRRRGCRSHGPIVVAGPFAGTAPEFGIARHPDAQEIRSRRDQRGGLRCGLPGVERPNVAADPGLRRFSEHADQLATSRSIRVEPLERPGHPAAEHALRLSTDRVVPEQLTFGRQIDVPGGNVERQLLRIEPVLDRRDRERESDPPAERARPGPAESIHHLERERSPARRKPADTAEAKHRSFAREAGLASSPDGQRASKHERPIANLTCLPASDPAGTEPAVPLLIGRPPP